MLKADGFKDAVIGIGVRCSCPTLIAYDYEKCVKVLMEQNMTYEQAVDYMEFNVTGAWVGENTPIFIHKMDMEEIDEYFSV